MTVTRSVTSVYRHKNTGMNGTKLTDQFLGNSCKSEGCVVLLL